MAAPRFTDVIATEAQLRAVIGFPSDLMIEKCVSTLDRNSKTFIAHAPFALLSTANREGRCDVSPRGDAPGFVRALDERTLLLPDRPGNRRADSLLNLIENPRAGLLFVIPGLEHTLRVNGRATIVQDAGLLASLAHRDKTPRLAIAIETEEVFFQCAKAFKRSSLWQPARWPDASGVPTLAQILLDQMGDPTLSVETVACDLEEAYRTKLY